jgi:DNA (cytosine-5)-methyltransferase 1
MGYHRAGFEVVGVDHVAQPRYPLEFVQADALEVLACLNDEDAVEHYEDWLPATKLIHPFDAIHASPPCQAYTKAQKLQGNEHPDLIGATRRLLVATGLPYVIENVVGAPLRNPVLLEGTMFAGLKTLRQRLFETNWPLKAPRAIYEAQPHAKMGRPPKDDEWMHVVGNFSNVRAGRRALGIHWATRDELSEAIPPAYTEYVGWELAAHLVREEAIHA